MTLVQSDQATPLVEPAEGRTPMGDSARLRASNDPTWTGIIEVLVATLGGTVRWDPDSVELRLPGHPHSDRVADLDALRLSLAQFGMPVIFEVCSTAGPDPFLVDFMRSLREAGLTEKSDSLAA